MARVRDLANRIAGTDSTADPVGPAFIQWNRYEVVSVETATCTLLIGGRPVADVPMLDTGTVPAAGDTVDVLREGAHYLVLGRRRV